MDECIIKNNHQLISCQSTYCFFSSVSWRSRIILGEEAGKCSKTSLQQPRGSGETANYRQSYICICPCLKWVCLGWDWLWLHFGETVQSGFLESVTWLRWSAGCSPEREQSIAGTTSTSKLLETWTEPASGRWKKSDPLTTNPLKIPLKQRNTNLAETKPQRARISFHR